MLLGPFCFCTKISLSERALSRSKRKEPLRQRAGRLLLLLLLTSCRTPYAGVSRIRFQGTLSTPSATGVPLAVYAER